MDRPTYIHEDLLNQTTFVYWAAQTPPPSMSPTTLYPLSAADLLFLSLIYDFQGFFCVYSCWSSCRKGTLGSSCREEQAFLFSFWVQSKEWISDFEQRCQLIWVRAGCCRQGLSITLRRHELWSTKQGKVTRFDWSPANGAHASRSGDSDGSHPVFELSLINSSNYCCSTLISVLVRFYGRDWVKSIEFWVWISVCYYCLPSWLGVGLIGFVCRLFSTVFDRVLY